ncbi:hypothetical protein HYDPIDRAFT_189512 [Hydnomerulius pinastri MD-312]|uniref:Uncharacterized protein n=1 Tax=Hydnomerulius pinastri MD-312 TaxID=994086 RepID=A0A0C9WBZ3_9AGAM|nr:hypothetical protein HYDPIDRAFT_189512 [Hydnomerulius pinastri MD-312]
MAHIVNIAGGVRAVLCIAPRHLAVLWALCRRKLIVLVKLCWWLLSGFQCGHRTLEGQCSPPIKGGLTHASIDHITHHAERSSAQASSNEFLEATLPGTAFPGVLALVPKDPEERVISTNLTANGVGDLPTLPSATTLSAGTQPSSASRRPLSGETARPPPGVTNPKSVLPIRTRSSAPKNLVICAMSTARVGRYDRGVMVPKGANDYSIPEMTTSFSHHPAPTGWVAYTHPEGALYYYHPRMRMFTDADLSLSDVTRKVEDYARFIYDLLEQKDAHPPLDELQLVIELIPTDTAVVGGYYFVNPRNRCLFWLDDFNAEFILQECKGVTSLAHKRYEIEAHYWRHVDLFPHASMLSADALDSLQQLVLFAISDAITSNVSNASAFSADVLTKILSIRDAVKVVNGEIQTPESKCYVARIMNHFMHNSFLNFHGERGARLCRDQTVHGDTFHERSALMTFLSPLLFRAPYVHIRSLHGLYVDSLVNIYDWGLFLDKLNKEVQDFNLLATVLLNANVGFLAINSVDLGSGRSLSQVASYMSMVSSFGSMVLGVMLVRQSYTQSPNLADDAVRVTLRPATRFLLTYFLQKQSLLTGLVHPKYGLETLAIAFSLPYALLMWGMIFFMVAFFAESFHTPDVVSAVPVASIGDEGEKSSLAPGMRETLVTRAPVTSVPEIISNMPTRHQTAVAGFVVRRAKRKYHDDGNDSATPPKVPNQLQWRSGAIAVTEEDQA